MKVGIIATIIVSLLLVSCAYRKNIIAIAPVKSQSIHTDAFSGGAEVPIEALTGVAVPSGAETSSPRLDITNADRLEDLIETQGGTLIYSTSTGKSTDLYMMFSCKDNGTIEGFIIEEGEVFKNIFDGILGGVANIFAEVKNRLSGLKKIIPYIQQKREIDA